MPKTNKNGNGNGGGHTGVDAASKAAGADESKKVRKAKSESKKPDQPGEKDGEVKDGFRWDKAASDWVEHRGTDFTQEDAKLPSYMEYVGDGSPEKPHAIRNRLSWS